MQYYRIAGSSATQTFLLFFDRFFDMLNVRSKGEYVHTRKEDMKPYTSTNDERLKVYFCKQKSQYKMDLLYTVRSF